MSASACHHLRRDAEILESGNQTGGYDSIGTEHVGREKGVVSSSNKTVGEFFTMEYGPAAGDAPHNINAVSFACISIYGGFDLLEPADGYRGPCGLTGAALTKGFALAIWPASPVCRPVTGPPAASGATFRSVGRLGRGLLSPFPGPVRRWSSHCFGISFGFARAHPRRPCADCG